MKSILALIFSLLVQSSVSGEKTEEHNGVSSSSPSFKHNNNNRPIPRPSIRRDTAGDVVYRILMMGNSYTQQNNVAGQLQHLLREQDGISSTSTVTALAAGGLTLSDHRDRSTTATTNWYTETQPSKDYDFVILQDQSQVPVFMGNIMQFNSKQASVELDNIFQAMGAETIFYMTWGRRYGDSSNPGWGVDTYKGMQQQLRLGYEDYMNAVNETNGRQAYMGPVGLAFEYLHDNDYVFFENLYQGDNSHVQSRGAYIAACVLFSTITGELCTSGSTTTYGFDSTTLTKLQVAADHASITNRLSTYPLPASKLLSNDISSTTTTIATTTTATVTQTEAQTTSVSPSLSSSESPSLSPSSNPSTSPSVSPSSSPSSKPSQKPSLSPSQKPSTSPSSKPSASPSQNPSSSPSQTPSSSPSQKPSSAPSENPSSAPSANPSSRPSSLPSESPSSRPSSFPSESPSSRPSSFPSTNPSSRPSSFPSFSPSSDPTNASTVDDQTITTSASIALATADTSAAIGRHGHSSQQCWLIAIGGFLSLWLQML